MPDTFTRIEQDFESEGSGGISLEVRKAAEAKRDAMVMKLVNGGCKTMESYADAVGVIRGLDLVLNFSVNKAADAQRELNDEAKQEKA